MKRYFTLPQKRKKRFSFVLGVGDITGTFKTKQLHLRYIPDALREEAGLFLCLAAAALSIRACKCAAWEWLIDWLEEKVREQIQNIE